MKTNGHKSLHNKACTKTNIPNKNQDITNQEKIEAIKHHFAKIMEVLGLNLDDSSLNKTPERVAKMYINEIFRGLDAGNFPKVSLFENTAGYNEMVVVDNITLYSYCEHHFVPFFGKVAVAYIPKDRVIGLSKINRIVQFIASKPQIQEKLTVEIGQKLSELLQTNNVAVFIEANHLCVASRGVKDENSITKTNFFGGRFAKSKLKNRFFEALDN